MRSGEEDEAMFKGQEGCREVVNRLGQRGTESNTSLGYASSTVTTQLLLSNTHRPVRIERQDGEVHSEAAGLAMVLILSYAHRMTALHPESRRPLNTPQPTTLFVDLQGLYPPWLLADTPLPAFLDWYLSLAQDPILAGARGVDPAWGWIRSFIVLEGVFQLPCFILGAIGLWKNDKRVYPVLLAYGASTATTLIPVLQALFHYPHKPALTSEQLVMLLATYVPFLIIPLAMALDMLFKLVKIVNVAQARKDV